MSNETPAEVLADFKSLIESDEPRGAGSYLIKLSRICGRFERALAAGKVAYTVECVHITTQEGTCFFEVKTDDPPENGAVLYTAPPADSAKASAPDLHPKTADLVNRFARALAEKLATAEKKYGYSDGWASPDWMDECRAHLVEHVAKGDPRDVAAYCAFLWHHGERTELTAKASGSAPDVSDEAIERALDAKIGLDNTLRQLIRGDTVAVGYSKVDVVRALLAELGSTATPPASAPEVTEGWREVMAALVERDGGNDCRCIFHSRDAEREYETSKCPHQRARALLAAAPAAEGVEGLADEIATDTSTDIHGNRTWEFDSRSLGELARRLRPQVDEAMVERAAKAAEYAETAVGYGWTAEQFDTWWKRDPTFCKQVNTWASFTGTRKQKRIHETRIALTAALQQEPRHD